MSSRLTIYAFLASCMVSHGQEVNKKFVTFDTGTRVQCREIEASDKGHASKTKVIEVTVRMTANILQSGDNIESIIYRLIMPESIKIVDFLPKTTVDTDVASNLSVKEMNSTKKTVLVKVEGQAGANLSSLASRAVELMWTVKFRQNPRRT